MQLFQEYTGALAINTILKGGDEWSVKMNMKEPMRKATYKGPTRRMDGDKGTDTGKDMKRAGVKATKRRG